MLHMFVICGNYLIEKKGKLANKPSKLTEINKRIKKDSKKLKILKDLLEMPLNHYRLMWDVLLGIL